MNKALPRHIAFIPDGNRRWAKAQGLPFYRGHEAGVEAFEKIGVHCLDLGIPALTFWGFSTENWKRSKSEIKFLFRLMTKTFADKLEPFKRKNVRINIIGRLREFPNDLQMVFQKTMDATKHNKRGVLNLCFNYGGRSEIIDAIRSIVGLRLRPEAISERTVADHLYTAGQPDLDLIIRTSGEQRLSGLMPWQSEYAELIFIKKYWPDFKPRDLDLALLEFRQRQRRFGQ